MPLHVTYGLDGKPRLKTEEEIEKSGAPRSTLQFPNPTSDTGAPSVAPSDAPNPGDVDVPPPETPPAKGVRTLSAAGGGGGGGGAARVVTLEDVRTPMELRDAESSTAPSRGGSGAAHVPAGTRVVLCGLKAQSQFNGELATVLRVEDRFATVMVEHGAAQIRLKRKHYRVPSQDELRALTYSPTPSQASEGGSNRRNSLRQQPQQQQGDTFQRIASCRTTGTSDVESSASNHRGLMSTLPPSATAGLARPSSLRRSPTQAPAPLPPPPPPPPPPAEPVVAEPEPEPEPELPTVHLDDKHKVVAEEGMDGTKRLGLYQNNGFSQYLTRAVYDAPTRSLAPDTLTAPEDRLVLSDDIDAFDALRRLAAMCDAAGVQHNIRLIASVQLNEQVSIRVEDNGRLGLYIGEGFEQYLTQAFYHPTHRRLCPDTLTAPTSRDAVEIAEDRLGSVLGDVVAVCEMAGVRHNIVLPPLPSSPPPVSRHTSAASVSTAARSSTVAAAAAAAAATAAKSSSSAPLSQPQQQSVREARRVTDSERDGGRRSGSRRRRTSVDGRRSHGRQQQRRSRSRRHRRRRRSGSASSDSTDSSSDDDDDGASSASSRSSSPPRRHRSRRSRSRSRRRDEGRRRHDRRHHRHESPSVRSTPSAPASPPPPPPPHAATGPTEAEKAMAAELERVRRELARTQELLRAQQPPRSGSGSGHSGSNSGHTPRAAAAAAPVAAARRSSAASSAFAPAASAGRSVGASTAVAEAAFCVHLLAAPAEGAEAPQALAFDRPPTIGEVLREVPPPPPGSAEAAEAASVLWVETPSEPLLTGVYALSGGETWNGAGVWAGTDADHVLFLNDSGKWTLATKRSHMRRSTGWVKARRALGAGALPHEVRAWVTNDGKAWRPDAAAAVAPLRKLMLQDRDGIWTRVVTSDQLYPGCRLWVGSTEDGGGAAATATAAQRRPGPAPFAAASATAAAATTPAAVASGSGGGGAAAAASAAGGVGGPGGAGGTGQLHRPLPGHQQQQHRRGGAATPSVGRGASPVGSPPRRSPPLPPRPFSTPALPGAEGSGGSGVGHSVGSSAYAAFGLGRPGSGGGGGGSGLVGGEVGGDAYGARPVHHRCISPTRPKKGGRASYPPDPRSQTGGS